MLAILTILLSWIFALLCAIGVAAVLIKMDVMMVWYSQPKFTLLLYGLPALFGMLLAHFIGNKIMKKVSYPSIPSFVSAHLIVYTVPLFLLSHREIMSSFLLLFWVVSPFLFLCVIQDNIHFLPAMKSTGIYFLHMLATIIPAVISFYHINALYSFFGPLLGRTGTVLPPDIVIAVLAALSVAVSLTYFMNLYHHAVNMRRFLIIIGIFSLLPFLYVQTGRMHPYSANNPVTPKRLLLQHTLRTFHNYDGSLISQDSGIWVQPMDYNNVKTLKDLPFFSQLREHECKGSYCGLPYYYAMRKVIRDAWYLHGERPEGNKQPLSVQIYRKEIISEDTVRFYFDLKGPDHMNLFLTLKPGTNLTDWSMYKDSNNHIVSMTDHHGGNAFIVFYSHGYYADSFKFWLEFKTFSSIKDLDLAELAIARHYLHGKEARTKLLKNAIKALPTWVCDNSWTSNYDSFILRY